MTVDENVNFSVFFAKEGEKGLNETSAAHLCALASQIKDNNEKALENVSFVNTTVNVIGATGAPMQTEVGLTSESLKQIELSLAGVSRMNAFISWFAEARKALEAHKNVATKYDFSKWCKANNITSPEVPKSPDYGNNYTTEDVIRMMNIKERQTYLALEAEASTLGKFIHPDQPMDCARRKMHTIATKPYKTDGNGRDTLIYHYTTSLPVNEVDTLFNQLQHKYRSIEQSLNHMKSDIRKKCDALNLELNIKNREKLAKYNQDCKNYQNTINSLRLEYEQYLRDLNTELSKIKFAIPEALADTVEFLNNVDKKG